MAATISEVRWNLRDTKEPFTFPDEVIQRSLDVAADFLYRRYNYQGNVLLYQSNDPAIMPVQTGMYYSGRGIPWVDYWLNQQYLMDISTPIGGEIQGLMASCALLGTLLMPTPDRTPVGVSEISLSIQWGGNYRDAIDNWNSRIEKLLFSLQEPLFVMYDNY